MILRLALAIVLAAGTLSLPTGPAAASNSRPIERPLYTYYFDHDRFVPLADSVLARTRARLNELVGGDQTERVDIHLVADEDRFLRLVGSRFPEWGAAAALPARNLIVIRSPDAFSLNKTLRELLAHEYVHIYLAQRVGYQDIPRWFNEGLAQFVAMEWTWTDNLAMSKAGALGDFVPLTEIDQVNRFYQTRAQVAYGQSYLAVKYLHETYGAGSLRRFVDVIARGGDIDQALFAAAGASEREFGAEFTVYLDEHFNIVTLFANTVYLWIGLAIVVVIGAYLKYRKRRDYYRKWEEEEKYQSTDFDYGDPDNPEATDDDEPWRG